MDSIIFKLLPILLLSILCPFSMGDVQLVGEKVHHLVSFQLDGNTSLRIEDSSTEKVLRITFNERLSNFRVLFDLSNNQTIDDVTNTHLEFQIKVENNALRPTFTDNLKIIALIDQDGQGRYGWSSNYVYIGNYTQFKNITQEYQYCSIKLLDLSAYDTNVVQYYIWSTSEGYFNHPMTLYIKNMSLIQHLTPTTESSITSGAITSGADFTTGIHVTTQGLSTDALSTGSTTESVTSMYVSSENIITTSVSENSEEISSNGMNSDKIATKTILKQPVVLGIIGALIGLIFVLSIVIIVIVLRVKSNRRRLNDDPFLYFNKPKESSLSKSLSSLSSKTSSMRDNDANWSNMGEVKIKERLGGGHYGEVFRGEWNGINVALKKLKGQDVLKEFLNECVIFQKLRHPCITQYLGIYSSPEDSVKYIVVEYLALGSLDTLLRKEGKSISKIDLLRMARDAAAGMMYLESNRIVHRDLACRNLLVTVNNGKYQVKISDFGLTKTLGNKEYYKADDTEIPVKWCSVEILRYHTYSSASDVWAFGVTLWEIFSLGSVPYPGWSNAETADQVMNKGYRLFAPSDLPVELVTILSLSWMEDPKERPTFQAIFSMLDQLAKKSGITQFDTNHNNSNNNSNNSNMNNIGTHKVYEELELEQVNKNSNDNDRKGKEEEFYK